MKTLKLYDNVSTNKRRLEAVRRRLEKKNAEFREMTKSEQRVQIAKDVIAQLKTKKLIASSTYLNPRIDDRLNTDTSPDENWYDKDVHGEYVGDLQVGELTSQIQCEVCGIGSLFVTAVERNDKLKVNKLADGDDLDNREAQVDYLVKWFPAEMLDEVEDYFEVGSGVHSRSPIHRECVPDTRLQMIMENIISNKGKFDPEKGAHKFDRDHADEDGDE